MFRQGISSNFKYLKPGTLFAISISVMMDNQRSLKEKVEEIEAEEIIEALKKSGWVKARAARVLGITERMCGYKIKKYGISKEVVEQKERRV